MLQKKNATLENQLKRIKSNSKKIDTVEELKLKTEEDFYKEVIDAKYKNVMLAEKIELIEIENEMLKEEVKILKKSSKSYVLKVMKQSKREDEYEKEKELIQEEFVNIVEKLLVYSEEMNVELAEILEETDNTVEDYTNNNKELKEKLWKAIG